MKSNTITISDETLATLSASRIEGTNIYLPDVRLERKQYEAVNDVLVAMGGTWERRAKAHVFAADPTDLLDNALLTGQITTATAYEFFPTPPELARTVIELAQLRPGMTVLEPSAGTGALAGPAADIVGVENIRCIEVQERFAPDLHGAGLPAEIADFLTVEPEPTDRVVMNPPFSRQQDIQHIEHAWQFVKPGGRLVSIASVGVAFRQDRRATAFRELVDEFGSIQDNPDGAFKASGTDVRTVTVVLARPEEIAA